MIKFQYFFFSEWYYNIYLIALNFVFKIYQHMYYSKFSKDPKEHAWDMLQEAISSRLPAKSNQQLPGNSHWAQLPHYKVNRLISSLRWRFLTAFNSRWHYTRCKSSVKSHILNFPNFQISGCHLKNVYCRSLRFFCHIHASINAWYLFL